jgi:hypothetical protein
VFARQPCYPIPRTRDVGQWLCAPSFRRVCLYQAFTRAVKDADVTRTQQRGYTTWGAAKRAPGHPGQCAKLSRASLPNLARLRQRQQ